MIEQDFFNEAANVIVFDPSMKCTGWLWYRPHKHLIEKYGVIRSDVLLANEEFDGVMQKRMIFQQKYAASLTHLLRIYDPQWTQIVMEEPIGSQNSAAAWSLAMASMGVTSVTHALMRKPPVTYRERDAKMHFFNSGVVEKEKTAKYMWAYWKGQGLIQPKDYWKNESRKTVLEANRQAVADAMLILNLHLHNIHQNQTV